MLRFRRNVRHNIQHDFLCNGRNEIGKRRIVWRRVSDLDGSELPAAYRWCSPPAEVPCAHDSSGGHPGANRRLRGPSAPPLDARANTMSTAAQEFLRAAAIRSADLRHRRTIRQAIDHYDRAIERTRSRFDDWEAARLRCREIKWEAVNHLDRYLLEFEGHVRARGGHVFWAETSAEARHYITDLAARRRVLTVVKSKSMVTEEIGLRPALERGGVRVFETDLGEFIVQLRNEPPYHIMTPAMHLTRTEIADLFRRKLGGTPSDDPQELIA